MDSKRLTPLHQQDYRYGLEMALGLAAEKLAGLNIEVQCRKAGAHIKDKNGKEYIYLGYLGSHCTITLPQMEISITGGQATLSPRDRLLILHYLINADGAPPEGRRITYKEIADGATYFPTFYKRAIKPLLDNFGGKPDRLLAVSASLGGTQADYGDVSTTINAFTRVPLTIVMWYGDDELAPEANILFDASIIGYLSAEDITVLCEITALKLLGLSREI